MSATCGGALTTLQGEAATRTVTATDPDGTVTSFSADRHAPGGRDRDLGPDAGVRRRRHCLCDRLGRGHRRARHLHGPGDRVEQRRDSADGHVLVHGHRHRDQDDRRGAGLSRRRRARRIARRSRRRAATAPARPSSSRASSTRRRSPAPPRARASTGSSSRTPRPRQTATRPPRTGSGSSWAPSRTSSTSSAASRATCRRSATRSFSAATCPSSSTSRSSRARASSRGRARRSNVDAVVPPVDVDPASRARHRQHLLGAAREHAAPRPGRLARHGRSRRLPRHGGRGDVARARRQRRSRSGTGYAQRVFRDAHPLDDLPGPRRQRQRLPHPRRSAGV